MKIDKDYTGFDANGDAKYIEYTCSDEDPYVVFGAKKILNLMLREGQEVSDIELDGGMYSFTASRPIEDLER